MCALLGMAVGDVEVRLVGIADGDVVWVHLLYFLSGVLLVLSSLE